MIVAPNASECYWLSHRWQSIDVWCQVFLHRFATKTLSVLACRHSLDTTKRILDLREMVQRQLLSLCRVYRICVVRRAVLRRHTMMLMMNVNVCKWHISRCGREIQIQRIIAANERKKMRNEKSREINGFCARRTVRWKRILYIYLEIRSICRARVCECVCECICLWMNQNKIKRRECHRHQHERAIRTNERMRNAKECANERCHSPINTTYAPPQW